MKKTLFTLMTLLLMPTVFAKAALTEDLQHKLVELDRRENQAHVKLQKAEQDALMGNIAANKLNDERKQYEDAKAALEAELATLPNSAEVAQWLMDNHVGVEEK